MGKDLWTVDQVANALDMHPKTIRRYIRDGALKAIKVGGQWRIKADDLGVFMDSSGLQNELTQDLKGFIDGQFSEIDAKLQVCTIIDYYVDSASDAKSMSQAIVDIMNAEDPDQGTARFQYVFNQEEKKARFVLWGNPRFLARMLNAVADNT